jgi:hypothetical protein
LAKNSSIKSAEATPGALPEQAPLAPPPITNFVEAFEEAALLVGVPENVRQEDIPQEGDRIFIDQTVIGILIPEFASKTNSGRYEISGWLQGKGVKLKNYQQFNTLGITNYAIQRAPVEPAK